MKTLSNQYKLIKEGKGSKDGFLRNAKRQFPNYVPNHATYNQATKILKQKGIISENFVGTQMIGGYAKPEKQGYEKAFENFLKEAEAKAEEKKVTKEVEEDLAKTYDYKDEKNPDNMIFGQIQMGVYYEARLDKNEGKTLDEIKDIVFKNLAKDPIHYTKTGQFGVDVGYTDEAPSLGATDEPKGKYKSSGYGNLKENKVISEEESRSPIELVQDQIRHLKDVITDFRMMAYYGKKGGQFYDMRDADESPAAKSAEKELRKLEQKLIKLKKDPNNKKDLPLPKKPVNEIAIAGGLVTGKGFTSANYKDFFGLNEETVEEVDFKKLDDKVQNDPKFFEKVKRAQMAAKDGKSDELIDIMADIKEDEVNENIDPEVFQQLDSLMPRPILESFLESITTAYNEMQSAEESARDLKDDNDAYEFGPGPLLDYLVIQSQNAVGRDSDEKLIKSLVRMAMLGGASSF